MAYEHKPNTGSIFKNDKREKDGDPHGRGEALIDGVAYWVKAWTNDGAKGKWQKLTFQAKEERAAKTAQTSYDRDIDDEIPF